MIPTDFREAGRDLVERVQNDVDAPAALRRLEGRHRHRRLRLQLVAAAAVVLLVVGTAVLASRDDGDDVASPTPPPSAPSTDLPVTVYLALLDGFAADPVAGTCTGTDHHAFVTPGIAVTMLDATDRAVIATTLAEPGAVIEEARAVALGLPTSGRACLVEVGTARLAAEVIAEASLRVDATEWPPAGLDAGVSMVGRQLVYFSKGATP